MKLSPGLLERSYWLRWRWGYRTFRQIAEAAGVRTHTYAVINSADELLSSLKDAETGQRGYLLSEGEAFLEAYLAVHDKITRHLEVLRHLTLLSAAQKHLNALAPMVAAKLTQMSHAIELCRNHDLTAALALVNGGQGKQLTDSIRAEMASFILQENGLLA